MTSCDQYRHCNEKVAANGREREGVEEQGVECPAAMYRRGDLRLAISV